MYAEQANLVRHGDQRRPQDPGDRVRGGHQLSVEEQVAAAPQRQTGVSRRSRHRARRAAPACRDRSSPATRRRCRANVRRRGGCCACGRRPRRHARGTTTWLPGAVQVVGRGEPAGPAPITAIRVGAVGWPMLTTPRLADDVDRHLQRAHPVRAWGARPGREPSPDRRHPLSPVQGATTGAGPMPALSTHHCTCKGTSRAPARRSGGGRRSAPASPT